MPTIQSTSARAVVTHTFSHVYARACKLMYAYANLPMVSPKLTLVLLLGVFKTVFPTDISLHFVASLLDNWAHLRLCFLTPAWWMEM